MATQNLDERIGLAELRGEMVQMNKRMDDVNKRIDDLRADMRSDIQDLRATLRWVIRHPGHDVYCFGWPDFARHRIVKAEK